MKINIKISPTCFGLRPSSVSLALNRAKVIFVLKHSVKLRRYLLCDCVAACHGMAHVFYAVQNATVHSAQHTTHTLFRDMLPHNRILNKDVMSQIF